MGDRCSEMSLSLVRCRPRAIRVLCPAQLPSSPPWRQRWVLLPWLPVLTPPVWCNWTIQVPPGKRLELYLEDFTPSDACQEKSDQIHLDESPAAAGGQGILERCWRKARYTSVSNTVQVVLLIDGNRRVPYRGFYGRFKAFRSLDSPDSMHEGEWMFSMCLFFIL